MKELKIHGNYFVKLDDEDFDRISKFKWRKNSQSGNVTRSTYGVKGPEVGVIDISIAKEVMKDYKTMFDHKDRDTLNNQKYNLRPTDYSLNAANRTKIKGTSSKYRGVTWHKRDNKWQASIQINGRSRHLGYFTYEINAAKSYDKAAKRLFGEFANLNFQPFSSQTEVKPLVSHDSTITNTDKGLATV